MRPRSERSKREGVSVQRNVRMLVLISQNNSICKCTGRRIIIFPAINFEFFKNPHQENVNKAIVLELMRQLTDKGKSLEGIDKDGFSWLMPALRCRDIDICQIVLQALKAKKIPAEVMSSSVTNEDGPYQKWTTALFWVVYHLLPFNNNLCSRVDKDVYKATGLELINQVEIDSLNLGISDDLSGHFILTLVLYLDKENCKDFLFAIMERKIGQLQQKSETDEFNKEEERYEGLFKLAQRISKPYYPYKEGFHLLGCIFKKHNLSNLAKKAFESASEDAQNYQNALNLSGSNRNLLIQGSEKETDHFYKRGNEQKYQDPGGKRKTDFFKIHGIFAQKTLTNVDKIGSFNRKHIQPLKYTLKFRVEGEEMQIVKKYALCMDITSICEAVGDNEFAGCFDKNMVERFRHMRDVFTKCFFEVNRFRLDQLEVFGKSLIMLSSGKAINKQAKIKVDELWSQISKIDVSDKAEEMKGQIEAVCANEIAQLMEGGLEETPLRSVCNRAFEYLQNCRYRADPKPSYFLPKSLLA